MAVSGFEYAVDELERLALFDLGPVFAGMSGVMGSE
jgi:hypothetical protein